MRCDHVDLGSYILILEKVAEAQEGQPWGSGRAQLVGRSLPGKLRGAADRQQRHSTDAGGERDRERWCQRRFSRNEDIQIES